jgi:hypothetical protein
MIRTRAIKFYVDSKMITDDGVVVVGRCLSDSITCGDEFRGVIVMKEANDHPGRRAIHLRVIGIDVGPAHNISQIDESYVGCLELVGSGAEFINDGKDILVGESILELPKLSIGGTKIGV